MICATARNPAAAVGLQKLRDDHPHRVRIFEADVTEPSSLQKLREAVSEITSSLDQVIFNAGVLEGQGPITSLTGLDGLKKNISVNLFGAQAIAAEFYPAIQRSEYSKKILVFIGSSFGSVTTVRENFEMHNQVFKTNGVNVTAAYDISKVCNVWVMLSWKPNNLGD